MDKFNLSNTEKKILRALSVSQYEDGMFDELSQSELNVASSRLKEYGLINAAFVEGGKLLAARILDEGLVYLKENPNLENPFDDDKLKEMQLSELKHKKRLRIPESVNSYWKLIGAIIGIAGLIGWLLYFLKII